MAEPRWHTLDRVRQRPNWLMYEVEINGAVVHKALPFVICVLADLSADQTARTPLAERKFLYVDRDNFNDVMAALAPRLVLSLPQIQPDPLELHFRKITDFDPAQVLERLPPSLGRSQIGEVIHHPRIQKLESSWRGLHYLVFQSETSDVLKIKVLDVSKKILARNMGYSDDVEHSHLYKRIVEDKWGALGFVPPVSFLVADYEFDHNEEDISLLKKLASLCRENHSPLVAAASPGMFGLDTFDKIASVNLEVVLNNKQHKAWNAFRDSEESCYIALALPRVLARLPAKNPGARVESRNLSWMTAAWTFATRLTDSFARTGWFTSAIGIEFGKVEGLPVYSTESEQACSTEIAFDERRENELSNHGFLPLMHCKGGTAPIFSGASSCYKPKRYFDVSENMNDTLMSKVNYLLCACHIAHYLQVICEIQHGELDSGTLELRLNNWLEGYTYNPSGRSADALRIPGLSPNTKIRIQACRTNPAFTEIDACLSPLTGLEEVSPAGIRMTIKPMCKYMP